MLKTRIFPTSWVHTKYPERKPVRFDLNDEPKQKGDEKYEEEQEQKSSRRRKTCCLAFASCCCTSGGGFTPLGLALSVTGVLFLVVVTAIVPLIVNLKLNTGSDSTSKLRVVAPKRLGVYYGWPSLVQGAQSNLSSAIATFSQFDLLVFGDGLSSSTHGDHINTQIIIQALGSLNKLTFGYVDLGTTTQNLSIAQMQSIVSDWADMGINGIMFDDAGYDYGVTRDRQNIMISYCHSRNLAVMMNAWEPDDVMSGTPMLLDSRDYYLLESYLISKGAYQNLTTWKIKADKCLSYSNTLGISMAALSTGSISLSASFGSTPQFSQAWFGTAIYNFNYFQATDPEYSSSTNILYVFTDPVSLYGTFWQTSDILNDSNIHYYRSTDTYTLHIYGDGVTYGSGNLSLLYTG